MVALTSGRGRSSGSLRIGQAFGSKNFGMKAFAPRENRSAHRRRIKQRAVVILKPGIAIECTALDTSDTGARLNFRSRVILPRKFRLHLTEPAHETNVSVVWQKGTQAGVRYAVRLPGPKLKSAGLVRRLWASR